MSYHPVEFASADALSHYARSLVCNGIGPAFGNSPLSRLAWLLSFPALFVARRLGLLTLYEQAGNDHDLHYFMGGSWRDKRLADGVFLGQLLDLTAHWPLVLRPGGWVLCLAFFLAVALGGWGSFQRRAKPLTLEQAEESARKDLA